MPEYICNSCGNSFEAEPDMQGNVVCTACRTVSNSAELRHPLPTGTRVNGYEIIRHIAAGGCGSVYLAEQIAMERMVALKILNREQVDKDSAERFLEEARNTAKFENPHVVPVIDTGISPEGYYYIAMQYVEGETLEEILEHGRIFQEKDVLMIAIAIAEALRAIWNKYRMFHKDIKPGNIMLTPEKEPMILDMGTAQERGESKLINGEVEGSPYYMSPEQARGEPLTWSTDLYSLGATMYQMVTGQYPYDAPDLEDILRQHDSAPFPLPASRAPGSRVSDKMTALLQRMMEKTPAGRYPSWEAFIRDARSVLESCVEKGGPAAESMKRRVKVSDSFVMKPVMRPKKTVSPLRFFCFGLLLFSLTAALAGGICLYFAVQRNSLNARILLASIRKQAYTLSMNPDAVDELIRKAEPCFNRIGVLPSVREEFNLCRRKTEEYRELALKEEKRINELESLTAEKLRQADRLEKQARSTGKEDYHAAMRFFRESADSLRGMEDMVKKSDFLLKNNMERAGQLSKRLQTALRSVQREQRLFQRVWAERRAQARSKKPEGMPMSAPARPAAASGKTVRSGKESPAPVAGKVEDVPEKEYYFQLEQEKNRIRVQLLMQPLPEKFRSENSVLIPRIKRRAYPDLNRRFDSWLGRMNQLIADAAVLWNVIYDSHQKLAGFYFTVATPEGESRMEARSILRNMVVLYRPGMPNMQLSFDNLLPAEWLDFLFYAASRKKLRRELDSFLLLDGWFFRAEKSDDVFIRGEVPLMRKAYYGYLTGDEIPGIGRMDKNKIPEIIRKNQIDPVFAPYRAKLEEDLNRNREMNRIRRKE